MKKIHHYKQLNTMDCGPTCLRMISRYYGKDADMGKLRQLTQFNKEGVSLLGIANAAEKMGLKANGVAITFDQLTNEVDRPAILHWQQNHFIVLYQVAKNKIFVADPAKGLITYTPHEFKTKWLSAVDEVTGESTGIALLLEPTPDFYKENAGEKNSTKRSWSFLFNYVLQYKRFFATEFFKVKQPVVDVYTIYIPEKNNKALQFIMDTANIYIEGYIDSLSIIKKTVSGSRQEKVNDNFYKLCTPYGLGINRASEKIQELKKTNDNISLFKFKDSLTYFDKQLTRMYWMFIKEQPDTYTAVRLLKTLQYTTLDTAKLQQYSQNYISDYIKKTPLGKEYKYRLIEYKEIIAQNSPIPEFVLPDTLSKQINIYDFKGKYIILDFWASWCGPCIEEFPELQRIYSEYKSLGVEIVGISLDSDRDKWVKSINRHNIKWIQLSDLQGNESIPATLFYAISIPRKFLVSPEMKLIINNGSLEDIENTLSQLIRNK